MDARSKKAAADQFQLRGSDNKSEEFAGAVLFIILREAKMAVVVQYMVKPNPGSDLATILEMTHESAVLWRKYGGKKLLVRRRR